MSGVLTGFSHPLVDRVEGAFACIESRADDVVLTEGLADALLATTAAGLTPVLVTRPIARLSYLARYHLTIAGGRWLLRDGSRLRDPLSSLVADSVAAALAGDRLDDAGDRPAEAVRYLVAVSTQSPADDATELGAAVESLSRHLAGTAPAAWGAHEPVTLAWDRGGYTAASRAWMPGPVRWMIADAAGRARVTTTVRRTRGGVEESVTGILLAPPGAPETVAAAAVDALERFAAEVPSPLFGTVSVQPGRASLDFDARPVAPAVPVAALVGPRATRALDPDLGRLSLDFDARTAGRPRTPSIVVGFGRLGEPPAEAAVRFARALGTDQLTRLLDRAEGAS